MKKVKITVMRKANYPELIEKYEAVEGYSCELELGQAFISENAEMPKGFCKSAWNSIREYVTVLAYGGEDFFDGWMKDKKSAMLSCADGFRPATFYIETIEE